MWIGTRTIRITETLNSVPDLRLSYRVSHTLSITGGGRELREWKMTQDRNREEEWQDREECGGREGGESGIRQGGKV